MNQTDTMLQAASAAMSNGQASKAAQLARQALTLSPDHPRGHYIAGMAALHLGDNREAIKALKQAQKIDPNNAYVLNALGAACQAEDRMDEALNFFRRSSELDSRYASAFNNLGVVYKIRNQLTEAEAAYRRAVEIEPDFGDALNNWGFVLQALGQPDEANKAFLLAAQSGKCRSKAWSNYLLGLNYSPAPEPRAIFQAHQRWGELTEQAVQAQANDALNTERTGTPLQKIGYLSADFYQHSVTHFFQPVLHAHDRKHYQIYCYHAGTTTDAITRDLQAHASVWRDVSTLNDEELTRQIIADQIDILVDLSGHTGKHRLEVFARRAAPVQVTWLGYPNTTGLRRMDYRITDVIADPDGSEQFCTEKLLRLPAGFLCFGGDNGASIEGETSESRNGIFTFGSFNNLSKVTSEVLDVWARLLTEVPDSRLMLKSNHLDARANKMRLMQAFEQRGVASQRLILLGNIKNTSKHLQLYNDIDVALDPFPYGGTTTTCEALWMGVPVITLSGTTHASRVGASLLHRVGLEDLVSHSREDYIAIARKLVQDKPRLRSLRTSLRVTLKQSPLGDAESFTRMLEQAFEQAWRR